MLKMKDINNLQISLFLFKFKAGQLPPCCNHYFFVSKNNKVYSICKISYFEIAQVRTKIRELSVAALGPKIWNSLPIDIITNCTSLGQFKKSLTNYFVSLYSK